MEEEDDKTIIQTRKDKIILRKRLLGEDYEDDTESDTEFDETAID